MECVGQEPGSHFRDNRQIPVKCAVITERLEKRGNTTIESKMEDWAAIGALRERQRCFKTGWSGMRYSAKPSEVHA
jgi:hypothetical protein